eukprot:TRINITY_DN395_c0_g6_i1.p3 TRINITY_DN395_c0_g6~~TRINITY_DN395_c0_g6_i1.p3  ORF type:complete len:117 (-),score=48.08 TRINITY_DN395_c0_g6_i1:171-521(-)
MCIRDRYMGSIAVIGGQRIKNIVHVVLNNEAHESVGGQPTVGSKISFEKLAKACGYGQAFTVKTKEEIAEAVKKCTNENGPSMIEVKCCMRTRGNLGRPKQSPKENKKEFMEFLSL